MSFNNFGNEQSPEELAGGGRSIGNYGIARQSSIYSLTFDEFQSAMGGSVGKDFGSMNMDELLKSIWSAEETQIMGSSGAGAGDGLQRQGSLTLPRTLSQKTVDQVWRDVSKVNGNGNGNGVGVGVPNLPQREPTLREMTLEEFLVKAGVVREDNQLVQKPNTNVGFLGDSSSGFMSNNNRSTNQSYTSNQIAIQSPNQSYNNNGLGIGFQQNTTNQTWSANPHQKQSQIFPKQFGGTIGIADPCVSRNLGIVGVKTGSPAVSSDGFGKSNGDISSVSPVPFVFNGGLRGRKRNSGLEKVVERRQRRMIKNRESAARSRARKQAYTTDLEEEVAKLKEDNEELRQKQAQIMEMQKNKVLEKIKLQQGAKRRLLRRTQTGPW